MKNKNQTKENWEKEKKELEEICWDLKEDI